MAKKKMTKKAWESLKTIYLGADRAKKARIHTLKSDFEALRMRDIDSIDEFAGKMNGLANKIRSLGDNLEDVVLIKMLLVSIPDKFLQVIAAIEQFADVETMPIEEAIGVTKCTRNVYAAEERAPAALMGMTEARGKWHIRGKGGHGGTNTPRQGSTGGTDSGKNKSHIKCFNCNNMGTIPHNATVSAKTRR